MKSNGKSLRDNAIFGPLTFKRKDELITFFAQPVWDYKEFDRLCPLPENTSYAFIRNERGRAEKVIDKDSSDYKALLEGYDNQKWGYYIIKSLEPSFAPQGSLEWDKVSPTDPKTWGFVEEELRGSLAFYEFTKVMNLVDEANALNAAKLEENAESFFHQEAKKAIEDQKAASSDSSKLVNASA
jgi:hypothetical protein